MQISTVPSITQMEVGFLNPANMLTTLRVILSFAITLIRIFNPIGLLISILLIIAGITDYLDGAIARRFGFVTRKGGFYDKGTDKLFTVSQSVFMLISYYYLLAIFKGVHSTVNQYMITIMIILVWSLFVEEFLLFISGVWAYRKNLDVKANRWGRYKMTAECLLIYTWSLFHDLCPFGINLINPVVITVLMAFLVLSVLFAGWSLDGYWERYSPYLIPEIKALHQRIKNSFA